MSKINLGNLNTSTLRDAFHSQPMNDLRKLFRTGRLDEGVCGKCISREASQGSSMRTMINTMFEHRVDELLDQTAPDGSVDYYDLRFVDFVWSNKCNFKCVHCNPSVSSSLASDPVMREFYSYEGASEVSISDAPGVVDSFLDGIQNVEILHFNGGEPFMIEDHYRVLDRLIEIGRTDIRLWIHTNGSMLGYKGNDILKYITHFPNTKISASHDGMGMRGQYVRHGYLDKKFIKTINAFRANGVRVEAALSVHALNVWSLPDILDWYGEHSLDYGFNVVTDPQHIRFDIHDRETKLAIAERLTQYGVSHPTLTDKLGKIATALKGDRTPTPADIARFKKYLDIKRGMNQNAYEYFPEYREFFNTIGWI